MCLVKGIIYQTSLFGVRSSKPDDCRNVECDTAAHRNRPVTFAIKRQRYTGDNARRGHGSARRIIARQPIIWDSDKQGHARGMDCFRTICGHMYVCMEVCNKIRLGVDRTLVSMDRGGYLWPVLADSRQ